MTVTYTAEVSRSTLATFLKLLLRWRGSVYKLVWKELAIFLILYYILSFVYRFALSEYQKRIFESISVYCSTYNELIPVAFVLGFYVSIVVGRWWDQFRTIPWASRVAFFVNGIIHGEDEHARLLRRSVMRYTNLSYVILMSSISAPVKKRFPKFSHMTEVGLMLPSEQAFIEESKCRGNKYFIPLLWCNSIVNRARREGKIKDDLGLKTLLDEINAFRGSLAALFNYDLISVPLLYTQVVTLSVYTFFLSCLMGRQFLESNENKEGIIDMYVPFFTTLQFLFYMGWLKVAEALINPFGEDDDDFNVNNMIDNAIQNSYYIVDDIHANAPPELMRDQYWDEIDVQLPYTAASEPFRMQSPHLGSAMNLNVGYKESEYLSRSISRQVSSDVPDVHIHGSSVKNSVPPAGIEGQRYLKEYFNRSKYGGQDRESIHSKESLPSEPTQHAGTRTENGESKYGANESSDNLTNEKVPLANEEVFEMVEFSDEEEKPEHIPDSPQRRDSPPKKISHTLIPSLDPFVGSLYNDNRRLAALTPVIEGGSEDELENSELSPRTPREKLAKEEQLNRVRQRTPPKTIPKQKTVNRHYPLASSDNLDEENDHAIFYISSSMPDDPKVGLLSKDTGKEEENDQAETEETRTSEDKDLMHKCENDDDEVFDMDEHPSEKDLMLDRRK